MVAESPYSEQIASCFMGLNDDVSTFDRIREVADPKDWAMHKSDEELKDILGKYADRSRKLGKKCVEFGLPHIDVSRDFLAAQEEAYYTHI